MGTVTIGQSYSSMAKVLCVVAWAGLVTAAPYYQGGLAGGSSFDTEAVVDTVMRSLDINQAIAEAMRGLTGSGSSFTGTLTRLPQTTVKISGSSVGDNSLAKYSGVSRQGGSRFSLQSSSGFGGSRSSSSVDKTAVVGTVLTVLNPQIEKAVAEALRAVSSSSNSFGSTLQQSNSFGSSFGTLNQKNTFSSGSSHLQSSSRQDESALVSQIISALTPTITQSVKKAISSGQSSSINQQSFMNSVSQTAGFSSGLQQTSAAGTDQTKIAKQVLTALAPTITSQVQAAIASLQSSSSSSSSSQSSSQVFQQSQGVSVSEQETSRLVRQIITTLTPSITSSVRAALRAQSQTSVSSSSTSLGSSQSSSTAVDQSSLITRIMSVLQPRIMTLVSDAITAQEAAAAQAAAAEQRRQAALIEQQRQAALREQQRQAALLEQQRQAALIEQQRQAALREQQRIEAQRQAALLEQQRQQAQSPAVGSSNLNSLFGSGHEVVHEIPGQSKVEYNIGMRGQLQGGIRRTNYN